MMLMAKAMQRLEKHAEALEQLEAAMKIELENHTDSYGGFVGSNAFKGHR